MVIYRRAPGEAAPWGGRYSIVREWGEQTGTVFVKRGERLPLVEIDGESELWFVYEDEPGEAIHAA
jgi:hypothetical protein